jgi:hypothetical protein
MSFSFTINDMLSNKYDSYIEEKTLQSLSNDFSVLFDYSRIKKSFESNILEISKNNDKTIPNFISTRHSFNQNEYDLNQSISLNTTENNLSRIFKSFTN